MAVILYERILKALLPCELRILTTGTKISWGLFPFECQYFFSVGTQCVFSFCPALNLSLRWSTVLYTVLVHDTADAGIVFTKLWQHFFCDAHFTNIPQMNTHSSSECSSQTHTVHLQSTTHNTPGPSPLCQLASCFPVLMNTMTDNVCTYYSHMFSWTYQ